MGGWNKLGLSKNERVCELSASPWNLKLKNLNSGRQQAVYRGT